MRFCWLLAIVVLGVNFSCTQRRYQEESYLWLQQVDSLMEHNSQAAWDTLQNLNPDKLSRQNQAYFNLLYTISGDKCYRHFANDSVIRISYEFYKQSSDYVNYARSAFYRGLVYARNDSNDPHSFLFMTEAKQVCDTYAISDEFELQGHILFYLGEYYLVNLDYEQAGLLLRQAATFYEKSESVTNYVLAQIHYVSALLNQNKELEAFATLHLLESDTSLSDTLRYSIFDMVAGYFSVAGNYEKEGEYRTKKIAIGNRLHLPYHKIPRYSSDARYFYRVRQLDSALFFAHKLEEALQADSLALNQYKQYNLLSLIYQENREFEKALQSKQKAYSLREQFYETDSLHHPAPERPWIVEVAHIPWPIYLFMGLSLAGLLVVFLLVRHLYCLKRTREMEIANYKRILLDVASQLSSNMDQWSSAAQDLQDRDSKIHMRDLGKHCLEVYRELILTSIQTAFGNPNNPNTLKFIVPLLKEKGFSNKEIASLLCVQESSVRTALARIENPS